MGAWAVPMDDAERVEVMEALAHVRRRAHHLSSKGKGLGSSESRLSVYGDIYTVRVQRVRCRRYTLDADFISQDL